MNISALARKLFRRTSYGKEGFVVVSAFHPDGISAREGIALKRIFNKANSDGWWFLNPGTFQAFFRLSDSASATALAGALRNFRFSDSSPAFGIGTARGTLICELLPSGKLARPPVGDAVSQSLIAAHADIKQQALHSGAQPEGPQEAQSSS